MSFQAMAWAIKQEAGDPASRLLLLIIANYADDTGKAWPSQATLAKQTGMSERSIRRHTDALVEAGFISVETQKHAGGTKLIYRLTPPDRLAAPHRPDCPVAPAKLAADPIKEPIKETKATAKACALPLDWSPDSELLAWAAAAFPNLKVSDELETFRNHFLATGKTMLRWDFAFRNWLRRSAQFNHARPVARPARLAGTELDAANRASARRSLDDLHNPRAETANRLFKRYGEA